MNGGVVGCWCFGLYDMYVCMYLPSWVLLLLLRCLAAHRAADAGMHLDVHEVAEGDEHLMMAGIDGVGGDVVWYD